MAQLATFGFDVESSPSYLGERIREVLALDLNVKLV